MIARFTMALGFVLALLAPGATARADTRYVADCTCPICQTKFKATLAGSGTQFGMRLDLRPIGPIASPWPVAVCTKCGFVLFKGENGKFTDEELKSLRQVVESDAYKMLPPATPSYQRVGLLYEGFKRPANDIAHAYLRASWQNEKDERANREMLDRSREWFQKYVDSSPEKDSAWQTAEFLRGELLRRVGKFDEAKAQFDRLSGMKEFEKSPFPALIAQEAALIRAEDKAPKDMAQPKETKSQEPAPRPKAPGDSPVKTPFALNSLPLALGVALFAGPAIAADPPAAQVPQKKPLRPLDVVEKVWPDHPEAVAMLVDILQGSTLGPNDGWFRKAVAQSRFTPKATLPRFDKNRDGRVARDEFPGTDADFERLDRDHDRALTANDFDFSPNALAPSPGASLFYRADADGDGKLTRQELDAFFQRADSGGMGFLSLDDAKALLTPPTPPPPPAGGTKSAPERRGPSKWTLIKGWYRQEIGSLQAGPKLDEVAPDFTLKTVEGDGEVTLSKLVGEKPVVLIFGNFTCGPFCSQSGNVEKLYRRYKDRANFVMVYVREAHPTDGWSMESNDRVGVSLRQPQSYEERVGVAQMCTKKLKFGMPMLVDTMGDTVGARYSGMPSRLYLLDGSGKVAYKSGRGPFGFKPSELEHSLLLMLNEPASSEVAKTR